MGAQSDVGFRIKARGDYQSSDLLFWESTPTT